MASRRMISLRLIDSARFLKMPISSQALYFHLALHADDDGVVEAFPVMRTVGCTEDDLRVLVAKELVQVLNEDLVTYITDWSEHNKIRPDRKIDSIYKDLLISIKPEVELVSRRPRTDSKNKVIQKIDNQMTDSGQAVDGPWTDNGQTMDGPWTDNGQTMDGPWTDNGPHRLGKDRLGEVREGKDRLGEESEGEESPERRAAQSASTPAKEPRHKYGEYKNVLLTDKDMGKLKTEFPNDWQDRIERLSAYIASTGKSYKNHLATIRNWARMDQERGRTTTTTNGVIQVTNKQAEELDAFYQRMTAWAESED